MKSLLLVAASAVTLTACSTQKLSARTALDCPTTQGELTRTGVAPDRKSCTYVDRSGDEISLRLIPVGASPQATLSGIERELDVQGSAANAAPAEPAEKPAAADAARAAGEASRAAEQAARDARQAAKAAGAEHDGDESADVDTGPVHMHVTQGRIGNHANIDLPGLHVHANDGDHHADVSVAGIHIDASENGAVIRKWQDVRLRGEALSRQKRGFVAMYVVARDNAAMGYDAAGPKTGPITVAVVKSASGDHHKGFIGDIHRLVRRNAGV